MAHTGTEPDAGGRTDSLLTIAEVACYLNASRSTIYRLMREGALRPLYFDDRPRFRRGDLDAFLDSVPAQPATKDA
jgi:excisionase family DNA binding protein